MGTYRNRFGPHNPDETYVAHAFPEQLVDLGEVQMNYVVVGRSRRAGAAADPRAERVVVGLRAGAAAARRALPGLRRRPARPGPLDPHARSLHARQHGQRPGPVPRSRRRPAEHRQRAVVRRCAVGVAVRVRQARDRSSPPPTRIRRSTRRRSSRPSATASTRPSAPMFRLWSTYLGDQWSIGDWEGMVAAAPDVLPGWLAGVFQLPAEPPQFLKEYDPEWGRAFVSGSVAASCDHDRMLRVRATCRCCSPTTSATSTRPPACSWGRCPTSRRRASRRCSPPPASAWTTGRSRRWATRCTGRTPELRRHPRGLGGTSHRARMSPAASVAGVQISRRSLAHAVSWWRLESCSLRSTADTWVSIVFTDRWRRLATSL